MTIFVIMKYLKCLLLIALIGRSIQMPKPEVLENPSNDEINYNDIKDSKFASKLRPLTRKDYENGRKLTYDQLHGLNDLNRELDSQNVLNNKDLFEGDIVVRNRSQLSIRNAIRGNFLKWRNGKIPYVLSNDYSEESRTLIARVFEEFHNKTCVRFVPKRWFHFNYLHLTPGVGCASLVGRVGGQQAVTLGEGCLTLGIIEHELLHSIGFWHEQSRADRDDFVRINWDNVEKGMEGNFVKFSWNDIQSLGVEYDYASVMHYGTHAFAKGFGATLSAVKDVPQGVKIGQRIAMSEKDIKKINNLYDCNKDVRNDNIISALLRLIIDIKNML